MARFNNPAHAYMYAMIKDHIVVKQESNYRIAAILIPGFTESTIVYEESLIT